MLHKITELQGMIFQNTLAIAAEISAAWKYGDKNESTPANLEVIGINLDGETVIAELPLKRVYEGTSKSVSGPQKLEYVGALFKTLTAGKYTHIYIKLDTKDQTIDVADVTFHNRIFPTPEEGTEIIETPDTPTVASSTSK